MNRQQQDTGEYPAYQLYFYVPESHKEAVKDACFSAGAGALGSYSQCAWEIEGTGQFLPGSDAKPHVGRSAQLEILREYRVEIVVPSGREQGVVNALLSAHPYETPAWGLIPLIFPK